MLDDSIYNISHHQMHETLIHGIDYIPMLSVSTSNTSLFQLQYVLINGTNINLFQMFQPLI